MRIVFLIPSMRAGGAERVFANLLSLWDASDELHLILLKREGPLLDQIPPSVTVHELGVSRFWRALPRLLKLVRSLSPDALLSTQAHMNAAMGLLRRWVRARRVVGRETNMPLQVGQAQKSSAFRRAVYRWGYRGLDAVVCLTQAMADELAALYGVTSVSIIPNPLRIAELRAEAALPLPSELAAMASGQWLVAVGRFSEQKGFDLLLNAMALLPDLRLCLIGDGKLRDPLERLARNLGVDTRVVFAGYQKNPHRLVARSSLFVLSSRYEGQPNAALEAMAQGVPVVSFDGPWGAREVILDGVTGCLAQPMDPAALAAAIRRALDMDWDKDRIQSWVEKGFNGPVVAARYREVLA